MGKKVRTTNRYRFRAEHISTSKHPGVDLGLFDRAQVRVAVFSLVAKHLFLGNKKFTIGARRIRDLPTGCKWGLWGSSYMWHKDEAFHHSHIEHNEIWKESTGSGELCTKGCMTYEL